MSFRKQNPELHALSLLIARLSSQLDKVNQLVCEGYPCHDDFDRAIDLWSEVVAAFRGLFPDEL